MIETEGYIACNPGLGELAAKHSYRPLRRTREEAKRDIDGDHWVVKVVGSDGMLYDDEPEDYY
jgi:hypothetical protein